MSKNYEMEDKALRLSIVILIVFAFAGIIFGTILSSDVVFFDGVFSLFSVIISFITLRISRFIHKQDHFNFPFGKENIEPVVVIIQYMILIGFLLYALYDAVIIILSGGSEVELGGVIIYLLFTTSLLAWYVNKLKKMSKNSYSALLTSELIQWKIDLKQSIFALISYLVSLVIVYFSYNDILPYIDPVILIFFIIMTFITILKEMSGAFKEVIGMRSISVKFHDEIENKLKIIVEKYKIKDYFLRINKTGSVMVIEVDFLVDKNFGCSKVSQLDEIREEFEKSISDIEYELWLSIAFTTQYKWIV